MFGKTQQAAEPHRQPDRRRHHDRGQRHFSGGLRVDGQVRGNVAADRQQPGTLVVSRAGQSTARSRSRTSWSTAPSTGPVHATEYLELQPKARVKGDVYYKTSRSSGRGRDGAAWCTKTRPEERQGRRAEARADRARSASMNAGHQEKHNE